MMKSKKRGFTLLEVLVVIVILTIGFVSFVPKLGSFFDKENNETIQFINTLITKAYKKAVEEDRPVIIWGVKGSNNIYLGGKNYEFKKDVFSVKVNDSYQEGLRYYFFIYPSGIMDKVEILFEDNEKVVSLPVLLRFELK